MSFSEHPTSTTADTAELILKAMEVKVKTAMEEQGIQATTASVAKLVWSPEVVAASITAAGLLGIRQVMPLRKQ